MNKSLYAYFGNLGVNQLDIPGHSFYQIALLNSLAEAYNTKFDFFSYIPQDHLDSTQGQVCWPDTPHAQHHEQLTDELVEDHLGNDINAVTAKIKSGEYEYLFLKARFRNLSTLQKGWADAFQFEHIIDVALDHIESSKIIILDTDLSLSDTFISKINNVGITRKIPSIDIPVISERYAAMLDNIMQEGNQFILDKNNCDFEGYYYGNLSFGSYKQGHSKNQIIFDGLTALNDSMSLNTMASVPKFHFSVCGKVPSELEDNLNNFEFYSRWQRDDIWKMMENSWFSINVSKDLYLEKKFIPARVFEALMFGNIPISYSPNGEYAWLHPAMCFSSVNGLLEIIKFLTEQSNQDLLNIYRTCLHNYVKYISNIEALSKNKERELYTYLT